MAALDDALLPVFASQHWLITMDDVRRLGGAPSAATRRVQQGRWEVVERSVFRLKGMPVSWEAAVLAPILSIGGKTVASHFTAAALHGIPGYGRGRPELSIERGYEHRRESARLHTSTDLNRCSTVVLNGVPATDLARTILDLGRFVGDRRLIRAIEWGRREAGLEWSSLISTLAHHARRGRPGIRRLRRVITENMHREEVTDSDFELLFLAFLAERGVPEPVLHHEVFDADRFVAEVDLAYPHLKIAIELDGSDHLDEEVRERDLPRQNDLILLGWTVLRFSWRRFKERPEQVLREVRDALSAASTTV
jgi:hypothetical protein